MQGAKWWLVFCVAQLASCALFASEGPRLRSMSYLQMDGLARQTLDYSCGAAALAFLLKNYFDDKWQEREVLADIVFRLSEDELKEKQKVGFSMLDLKQSAERLGYVAEGVVLSMSAALALKGPVIILLRREKSNHFVVLKGIRQGRAFLADPSRGHVRVPAYELFQEWKGEALVLGREGFGLPGQHGLSLPEGWEVAPERDVVRNMQRIPIN